jgi:hypothetical protein
MPNFASNFWVIGAGLWLAITTTLGIFSGWFLLMWKYPDRKEEALLQLKRQSGSMGLGVAMQGVLNISVCPSGLRVGIMRIFGPFCRNVFVPWEVITVKRKNRLFGRVAAICSSTRPGKRSLKLRAVLWLLTSLRQRLVKNRRTFN